jgi:exosome complex exonuclease DIS3/RRP44
VLTLQHYVKAGTAIDLEAARRSTSTYLVNRRLDMLPSLLTTDLCSLKGNVDRYAFSVLFEVTSSADIVDVQFKRSLIHSIGALTYQQAQTMIDQPEDPEDKQATAVKSLAKLARQFRQRRIEAGALTLASPEVKFVLDSESLNPTDVQAYAMLEANSVVEEMMLLANSKWVIFTLSWWNVRIEGSEEYARHRLKRAPLTLLHFYFVVTVSKKILRHYPTLSVLRRHPAPNRSMFNDLISKARSRGWEIRIDDSKQLADSLDEAQDLSDPFVNKLLRILSTRCMSPAQYFCSGEFRPTEWHHYGLAAPVYTYVAYISRVFQ